MDEQLMASHATGALRSPDDYRYINLAHLAGAAPEASSFPESFHVDYSQVDDLYQRQIGACTNHAFAEIGIHRSLRLGKKVVVSPRFLYTLSKINDNVQPATEQGTYPVMPFKMAVKFGVASTTTCENDTTLSFDDYIYGRDVRNVPQAVFDEANQNRIIPGYAQVGAFDNVTEAQLKQALMSEAGQDGVSILLQVGSEWYTAPNGTVSWKKSDVLPIRKVVTADGAHQITVTGWETENGRCKVFFRNHWSKAWASTLGYPGSDPGSNDGDNGFFYLDEHTIAEAWVVSEIPDAILAIVKSLPARADFKLSFARQLKPGMMGADVRNLQIALKIVGTFPFQQAVTEYFGPITRKAVMDFQRQYNVASEAQIIDANGEVGPKTQSTLTNLF